MPALKLKLKYHGCPYLCLLIYEWSASSQDTNNLGGHHGHHGPHSPLPTPHPPASLKPRPDPALVLLVLMDVYPKPCLVLQVSLDVYPVPPPVRQVSLDVNPVFRLVLQVSLDVYPVFRVVLQVSLNVYPVPCPVVEKMENGEPWSRFVTSDKSHVFLFLFVTLGTFKQ